MTTRRGRLWLFRVLATLYALFWLNVTLSASPSGPAHRLQEFGYRTLYAVGLVVVPAIAQLRRPERNVAAQQQLILTATAHMIGTFIALYVDPLAYVLVAIAIGLGVIHSQRAEVFVPAGRGNRWTVAAAAAVTVPLLLFAGSQARLLIQHGSSEWEDTMVFAIALVLTFAVAAARTTGWRVPTYTAGVTLGGYAVGSVLSPEQASSWGLAWGIVGAVGAATWIVVMELAGRIGTRNDNREASPGFV